MNRQQELLMEKGEEVGDGSTVVLLWSSATGGRGRAAMSPMPDGDGTHIFQSSQLEGSYVGDLLYIYIHNLYPTCIWFSALYN